jgi:hypothetical protein
MQRLSVLFHTLVLSTSMTLGSAFVWQHHTAWAWPSFMLACRSALYTPPAPSPPPPPEDHQRFRPEVALGEAAFLCWEIGNRPAGSDQERWAGRHLADRLRQMGYQVRLEDHIPLAGSHGQTRNILALLPGESEPGRLILGAHYDSVPGAGRLGANDNASGVGVLLEVARLMAGRKLPYSLQFAFYGAEELEARGDSLVGSAYSCRTENLATVLGMISVDMVGRGHQLYAWVPAGHEPGYLAALLSRSATALQLPLNTEPARRCSDELPFAQAGVPSLWLERLPDPDNHTVRDLPQNLSATCLEQTGKLLVHMLLSVDKADVQVLRKDLQTRG